MSLRRVAAPVALAVVLIWGQLCLGQLRGPPQVETKPVLLDSFIPASMQIIAHITELMKYDLKPTMGSTTPAGPTTPSTTTLKPTRPHKPGIFGPAAPLGPSVYFSRGGFSYQDYVERLRQPSGYNYFERYTSYYPSERSLNQEEEVASYVEVPQDLEERVGKGPTDILKLINTVEEDFENADDQALEFSKLYDDSDVRQLLLRQKKTPPTRAYVGLLSLYDLLNKESKKLGLNKYTGYSEAVLDQLVETSTGTSADQLKTVLSNISKRKDTNNAQILNRIDGFVKDLDQSTSYLSAALRYIPPLKFLP